MALQIIDTQDVLERPVKTLYYGYAGGGKTVASLTYPRVFAIDTEGRIKAYAGRDIQKQHGIDPFKFVFAQTIPELKEAIGLYKAELVKGNFATLVTDSMSSFFYDSVAKWTKKLEGKKDSNPMPRVNVEMREIMALFSGIDSNIVMTARITQKYKSTASFYEAIGEKPDSDKSIDFWFDYVVKVDAETHTATLDKQTGYIVSQNPKSPIKEFGYKLFEPAIKVYQGGSKIDHVERTPEQIIEANEHHEKTKNHRDSFGIKNEVIEFCTFWMERTHGTAQEIIDYLNSQLGTSAKGFSEFKIKISEAHTILEKAFPETAESN